MGKIGKEDLFREIGEIDEAYVEEAQRVQRMHRKVPWVTKTLAAAASLVLCVGVGYGVLQLTDKGAESSDSTANMAGELEIGSARQEFAAAEDGEDETLSAGGAEEMEEQAPEEEPEGGSLLSPEITELTESVGQEQQESSTVQDWLADEETLQSGSGAADLTWEEARLDDAYGKYVDVQVPEGYSYTSGTRTNASLHVIWSKGMEEISISCRQADEAVSDWLVDTDHPEEYDLGLYSIPWCDSVPEELISKVSYATFYPGQITLEIVSARTYLTQESGDVSGYRTRIGILYSDNVLVEIISKGPSPEEIYAMINLEN